MPDEIIDEVIETGSNEVEKVELRDQIVSSLNEIKEREIVEEPVREKRKYTKRSESAIPAVDSPVATKPHVEEQVAEQNEPAIPAPQSWSAGAREKWNTLPSDIKSEIAKREAEIHKGFTKFDEERSFGKKLKDVINPYMPIIQAEGGTPEVAISSLLNTAYILRTGSPQQKANAILDVTRQYGIDLSSLQQVNSMPPEINNVYQRLDAIERQRKEEEYRQTYQQEEMAQRAIAEFSQDPANVHFNEVIDYMSALLGAGRASDLKDAYDQACWANPSIRSTLVAEQKRSAEANLEAKLKEKTDRARSAGVSISGSPGSLSSTQKGNGPDLTLRELLQESMRSYGRI